MKGVQGTFNNMTEEDKEHSKHIDFELMMNEIDDHLQKWVDLIQFKKASNKQIALIDATISTMYSAMQDGDKLIGDS